jgi:hypothetical protein
MELYLLRDCSGRRKNHVLVRGALGQEWPLPEDALRTFCRLPPGRQLNQERKDMPKDTITITLPDHIPYGRKSSVLKGIIDGLTALMREGTTEQEHVPVGHEGAIQIGKEIAAQIERAIEERVARKSMSR